MMLSNTTGGEMKKAATHYRSRLSEGEADGTRTRNHRIDSPVL